MSGITVNRKTKEIVIVGKCGSKWAGTCRVVQVTGDTIKLDCDTELVDECPDMEAERLIDEVMEKGQALASTDEIAENVVQNLKDMNIDADRDANLVYLSEHKPGGSAGDKMEYRWENIRFGQGHYFNASDLNEAVISAWEDAREHHFEDDVIIVQQWKPKGPKVAIVPDRMHEYGGGTDVTFRDKIVGDYGMDGYDVRLIRDALEDAKLYHARFVGKMTVKPGGRSKSVMMKIQDIPHTVDPDKPSLRQIKGQVRITVPSKYLTMERFKEEHPGEPLMNDVRYISTYNYEWATSHGQKHQGYDIHDGNRWWAMIPPDEIVEVYTYPGGGIKIGKVNIRS